MDRERRIYGNRIFDGEEYFFLFVGKLIRLLIGYILEGIGRIYIGEGEYLFI